MDNNTVKIEKLRRGGVVSKNHNLYSIIVSKKNLFSAWKKFKRGKTNKNDVLPFALNSEENLLALHKKLVSGNYKHGRYLKFYVRDPKMRRIHKASVEDRIVHHAVFRVLYPIFERKFIFDSFASRKNKGTHAAIRRFESFAVKLSQNHTRAVWTLKCDIRKFFDSIDHKILLNILRLEIRCDKTNSLLAGIIRSFESDSHKGIPLGNLTSQLFANVYMNYFDQFVKRRKRLKYYVRYMDDFVILSESRESLTATLLAIRIWLKEHLALELHDRKVSFKKWHSGIDFLGYVSFPFHRILRTRTKKRIFRKLRADNAPSYFAILKHCRGHGIAEKAVRHLELMNKIGDN